MRPMGRLRWKMLALMLCGTIVIYVDRNVLGVLAPILKKDLDFSTEQYSYVVSAFQLVYSFSQPAAGYLTDLIGPRIGYAVAAVIWGAAAAAHGLATGWLSMAGFRAVLGLSEAVAIPTGTKVSTIWFPSQERSIATGWFNSGSSIGSMVTPPLVIWLASVYGWRPSFLITGTLGVLLGIVWFWLYRDPEAHPDLSADERAYITSGREPPAGAKPSVGAILSKTKLTTTTTRSSCPRSRSPKECWTSCRMAEVTQDLSASPAESSCRPGRSIAGSPHAATFE